jgi:hypothetical protein
VFKRLGNIFLIVALLATTGAHWAVLQSVAWTTMLTDNLRDGPFTQAVERTFDGRHPCPLCNAIAAGKKSERKTEFPLQTQKFEFPPMPEKLVFFAPARFQLLPQTNTFAESLTQKPLTPPPRGFYV